MRNKLFQILVIDEDPTQRTDIIATLSAFGFTAEGVTPGSAGHYLVSGNQLPDLIVVDLDRPWESRGIMAALRSLRRLAEIPLVGLSFMAPMPLLAAQFPTFHVRKPIVPEELDAAVHTARRSHARTQQVTPISLAFAID